MAKEIDKIYLGNIYGLHDGYDGSVFSPDGYAKTIVASVGGGTMHYRNKGDKTMRYGTFHYPHGWLELNAEWGGVVLHLMLGFGNITHY